MTKSRILDRLRELYECDKIQHGDYRSLTRNVGVLLSRLNDHPEVLESDEKLVKVCKNVVITCSYLFKEAFSESGYVDVDAFLNECWLHKMITLENGSVQVSVRYADVYAVCDSPDYLDGEHTSTALQFCTDDFDEVSFSTFVEALKKSNRWYHLANSGGTVLQLSQYDSLFDGIITADKLRDEKRNVDIKLAEAERLLSIIYKTLDTTVFKGVCNCSFDLQEINLVWDDTYYETLRKHQFDVSIKNEKLYVQCVEQDGDFGAVYSEDELFKMLRVGNGVIYSFVANYCKRVMVPRIVSVCVSEIIDALKRVTILNHELCFTKQKTRTDAYSVLFDGLTSRGFSVEDGNNSFCMRW